MIRVGRDLVLSSVFLAVSLAALAWYFLVSPGFEEPDGPHGIALVLGGLGAVFGIPVWANFLWARRVLRRHRAGTGVLARWHVAPAALRAFEAGEATHPNRGGWLRLWRPSRAEQAAGVEVIFGPEIVIVGDRMLAIPTAGVQAIGGIGLDDGRPPVLTLLLRTHLPSAGPAMTDVLRLPVTDRAAGATVLRHYRSALEGRIVVAPMRWVWRIRIGLALMAVLPFCVPLGWYLAHQPWRRSDMDMILPFVLMIGGIIGTLGAGFVVLLSWRFHRRQHGRR